MSAPLLVVTGTGTGIGKTVVSSGLVAAWSARSGRHVAGLKPVESGQDPAGELGGDALELARASTFHAARSTPPYLLLDAVSPHLAARREGRLIDLERIASWVAPIREAADAVVLELPGGLFSPLTDTRTNADLLLELEPTHVVLVAPDRLGVLHDVLATTFAARARLIALSGVILSAPADADTSTGTNAAELERVTSLVPVLTTLPRASRGELQPYLESVLVALGLLDPSPNDRAAVT